MLSIVNALIYTVALVSVFVSDEYGVLSSILLFTAIVYASAASQVAISISARARGNATGMALIPLIVFFWIAYVIKIPLLLTVPEASSLTNKFLSVSEMTSGIPAAFAIASLGLTATVATIMCCKPNYYLDWNVYRVRYRVTPVICFVAILLLIKYYVKYLWKLGIPGVEPISMGVPYLGGFVALAIGDGILFAVNSVLFLSLISGGRFTLLVGLTLALINCFIDLSFGIKFTLLAQILLIVIYCSAINPNLSKTDPRVRSNLQYLLVATVIFAIPAIVFYKYLNFVRFALLFDDINFVSAIGVALANENAIDRSSYFDFLNRFTGLDALSAVMQTFAEDFRSVGIMAVLDGRIIDQYSQLLLGGVDSKTQFSLTLWGIWFLWGGVSGVILGSVIIGIAFYSIQLLVSKLLPIPPVAKIVLLPIVWLSCALLLMGGTSLFLWLKKMFVLLTFGLIFCRVIFRVPLSSPLQAN